MVKLGLVIIIAEKHGDNYRSVMDLDTYLQGCNGEATGSAAILLCWGEASASSLGIYQFYPACNKVEHRMKQIENCYGKISKIEIA